jgi:hypothetical protein
MVAPVKNMEDFFVLHPVMNKNLSRFLKSVSICPESASEDNWSKLEKRRFCEIGGGQFWRGKWYVGPPLRW